MARRFLRGGSQCSCGYVTQETRRAWWACFRGLAGPAARRTRRESLFVMVVSQVEGVRLDAGTALPGRRFHRAGRLDRSVTALRVCSNSSMSAVSVPQDLDVDVVVLVGQAVAHAPCLGYPQAGVLSCEVFGQVVEGFSDDGQPVAGGVL